MPALSRLLPVIAFATFTAAAFAQSPSRPASRPADSQPRRWRQSSQPKTVYVAPTGSDAAAGTQAAPYKTIQFAIDHANPMDTVEAAGGTYPERLVFHKGGVMFRGNLIVTAAPGATVTIAGAAAPGDFAVVDTAGHDYITLKNLTIDGGLHAAGIGVTGSWEVLIDHCHVLNTNDSGIKVDKSGHVTVENCDIEKACQPTPRADGRRFGGGEESFSIKRSQYVQALNNHIHDTGHEGIDVKEGSNNVLVKGNTLDHVERQALYTDAWNEPTAHVRFEDNICHDCGFGMVAGSETGGILDDVWFVNNLVYNCQGPGLVTADWGNRTDEHPVRNVHFINNTIVGNHGGGRNGDWGTGYHFENANIQGLVVRNNIFSDNGAAEIRVANGKVPAHMEFDHNLIDGNVPDQFKAGNLLAHPDFADPAHGDFHLKPNSPALHAGSPNLAPATDATGKSRDPDHPALGAYAG